MHPAFLGSPIGVWFVDGAPVRLVAGARRLRVVQANRYESKGRIHWRVRARLDGGGLEILDLREDGAGWVLVGMRQEAVSAGAR